MTKVSGAQVRIRNLEALLDRALKMKDYWQVRALRAEGKIPHGHHGLRYGGVTRQSL